MDGTDAGAGEHRYRRLGNHRHVDQHAVALADAEVCENAGETRDLVTQLAIGEALHLLGDRAVPDQRDALALPCRDMTVERIPAGVEPGTREPAIEGRPAIIKHPVPAALPIDRLGRLRPEFSRPLDRSA